MALDNCASNHIFHDESDFIGAVVPMDPIDIAGLGKGQAIGYGNVKLSFRDDSGTFQHKILKNVWHVPGASVRILSVEQLDLSLIHI